MFKTKDWNANQSKLKKLIKKKETFSEAKKLLLEQHGSLHSSKVKKCKLGNCEDELWKDLDEEVAIKGQNKKGRTILYGIWHATRIEDMTMNILVNQGEQIFEKGKWKSKMKASFSHTGNSLGPRDILKFSSKIDLKNLLRYRVAVGKQTQKIIQNLSFDDSKRPVSSEGLKKILKEKGVLPDPTSVWLIDFWGRKTVEGLLFMPATRHNLIHLNESFEIKKKLK